MIITTYPDEAAWLIARKGKITGTALKTVATTPTITKEDIIDILERDAVEYKKSWSKEVLKSLLANAQHDELIANATANAPRKAGFYKLIAEQLATPDNWPDPMERGKALEKEAITLFSELYKKTVNTDLVTWEREDVGQIAISPDGYMDDGFVISEAVEVKCLSSATHMQAVIENCLPEEYEFQVLQYFIVNDDLETLYFFMYDPRLPEKCQHKTFVISRSDKQEEIGLYLRQQKQILESVNEYVALYK